MKANQINKAPLGIGWEILWKAWDLAKVNYKLSVLISFIIFLLLIIIPFIIGFIIGALGEVVNFSSENAQVISQIFGIIIGSFIAAIVPLIYTICAFHWEKREPYSLTKILADLKDKKIMRSFLPVITVFFLLSSGPGIIGILNDTMTAPVLAFTVLTYPLLFVFNFCYPLLFFKPETGLGGAFIKSLQGILKNILPLIIGLILVGLLLIICAICLVLPIILIAAPVYISFYYLWYRVIFEDLKLESDETPVI